MGLCLLGCLLILATGVLAEEPTSPFGQSNPFVMNTNCIGFGDTAILMVSAVPNHNEVPTIISLGNLIPNPFNPRITISFNVGRSGPVELNIYDLGGRCVKHLAAQDFEIGQYTRQWDGRDNGGAMMPAGVYLVRIKGDSATDSKKITLAK
ncbi:MAG: FlgD immunoglobulin-like domain containing protein [Candidatus Krumholzibacteria bacterium]|nr:FlgD immunoglobulin-like domain containing protein [Candidatus Krumholzibacteria bacterium]